LDMACGEGYGSEVLSRAAASVVGVDANPEAFEHARLRYARQNLRFERAMVELYGEPAGFDAVVFLQTIEHVQDPQAVLEHFKQLLTPGGAAYISTPNVLTLAPPGAAKSDNPWHLKEYRAEEFRALCEAVFDDVDLYGLFHARKLKLHALALQLGWDAIHPRLKLTKPFYDWFTPAITAGDFVLQDRAEMESALDLVAVCRTTLRPPPRPWPPTPPRRRSTRTRSSACEKTPA